MSLTGRREQFLRLQLPEHVNLKPSDFAKYCFEQGYQAGLEEGAFADMAVRLAAVEAKVAVMESTVHYRNPFERP